jgi:hypothetical protein
LLVGTAARGAAPALDMAGFFGWSGSWLAVWRGRRRHAGASAAGSSVWPIIGILSSTGVWR